MTRKFAVKPYFKKPRSLRSKPLLTIRDMAEKTKPATRKRARKVAILSVKASPAPPQYRGWVTYRVLTRNTVNQHEYVITVLAPQPRVYAIDKVIIDSPVPLFVFTYEYALAKRGNAFIYRSNGDPPVMKNPSNRPGLDHHAYAAVRHLITATRSIRRLTPQQVAERHAQ